MNDQPWNTNTAKTNKADPGADIEDVNTIINKQEAKEQRQMLKLQCLEQAIKLHGTGTEADNVVKAAKAFYAFVRT